MRTHTLICRRDMAMGLRCLGSLAQGVEGTRLVVHDDGSLAEDDLDRLRAQLPVAEVVPRRQADEIMAERLRRYPACARFRGENVLALKLLDVGLMATDDDIRYCDSDVLFLRRARGLFVRAEGDPAAVFMRDPGQAYAARPWHLLGRNALRLPGHVNSGLFMFRRELFDLDYLEWLLSDAGIRTVFHHIASWAEQTCWAALGLRAGCGLWDPECVAVVDDNWVPGGRTVAAHFVSPARHRFEALAASLGGEGLRAQAPVIVPVARAEPCSALALATSQLRRRMRRACGY